ncbi:penicillin-insensitive murein endopeptidase [Sorangium sp. So ce1504]|uniref:penicillin-insensitive murein endopeptidase n=1 Tax=Sorangium sp. So ce1504 TaxID=3133337 RepID=UPI003F62AF7A
MKLLQVVRGAPPAVAPRATSASRRAWKRLAVAAGLLLVAPLVVAHGRVWLDGAAPSESAGSPARGRLLHGHPLRPSGPGHVTYSYLGASLGRQYVHGAVRDALEEAFAACAAARPGRRFVVGETGHRDGGPFWPHRTHQNGLSVDIFVPLRDGAGRPADVSTYPWNKLGYGLEFDAQGRWGELTIDFDDLARLLSALDEKARPRKLRIQRIILAPEYVPLLLASPAGRKLGSLAGAIPRGPVWWRHDEHVHIDFAFAAGGPR